jgi:DNA repair protein RadC
MNENQSFIGIKEWPQGERPRERCLEKGSDVLSTNELIAILFRTGGRGTTAIDLARAVLKECGSLRGVASKSPKELSSLCGIGVVRAVTLSAALELSRRFVLENLREAERIEGADDAHEFLKPRLRDLPHEVFAAIFLNQKHGIISYRELFRGTINGSSVHPREVIKEALKENAAAVIFAHNHPSGNVSPSREDICLTEQLEALLNHLDVRLIDHIIVGGNGCYSFAREGLLPSKKGRI